MRETNQALSVDITNLHNESYVSFATRCCPACGHPMAIDDIAKILPAMPRKIYEMVKQAGHAGMHRSRIEGGCTGISRMAARRPTASRSRSVDQSIRY